MSSHTAFIGSRRLAAGSLTHIVEVAKAAFGETPPAGFLVFDDITGHTAELDLRGDMEEALARLPTAVSRPQEAATTPPKAGRGRPSLGVVAREVTLLPRHWDWLGNQPGGASVALRKLVEAASRRNRARDAARQAQEACHRFLTAMAGNLPGYEDVCRALFGNDFAGARARCAAWPEDIAAHTRMMLEAVQRMTAEAEEGTDS